MSQSNRPGFQKATKSSSAASNSSGASAGGGIGGGRWSTIGGGYAPGVSPVRGLSPVRSNSFQGVARQDMDSSRSHTNPLFNSRSSDTGSRLHRTPISTKAKENREKHENWKIPGEKAQYSGKTLCSGGTPGRTVTPGRNISTPKTPAPMRFATPPKPTMTRRKILAENREVSSVTPSRIRHEDARKAEPIVSNTPSSKEAEVNEPVMQLPTAKTKEGVRRALESDEPLDQTEFEFQARPTSPLASIEELQKRIQKFLETDELSGQTAAADSAAYGMGSTIQSNSSDSNTRIRRLSGPTGEEIMGASGGSCIDEGPYHPVFSPYSPRPDFLRARKSPTSLEDNIISPVRNGGDGEESHEKVTPTYDPRNNFLSPRPQFLRYKPLRHLEILRKSAETAALGRDLDIESPATDDAGSSRVESFERGEGDIEPQDEKADEVQSRTSSSIIGSPQRSTLESWREVQPVEKGEKAKNQPLPGPNQTDSEGTEQSENNSGITNEKELKENTLKKTTSHADAHAVVSEVDLRDAQGAEEQEDENLPETEECLEDDVDDSTGWKSPGSLRWLFSVLFVVVLLLVASGSPALLPKVLHENQISNFWTTSSATEPVRHLLQKTSGLWSEQSSVGGNRQNFPHLPTEAVHHGFVRCKAVLQWGIKAGSPVIATCSRCTTALGKYIHLKSGEFKEALLHYANYLEHSRTQEVNEWDWVPDYDFVVPRDMFDPILEHERLAARIKSSKWKSLWAFLTNSQAGSTAAKKSLSSSLRNGNFSVCALPARDHVVLPLAAVDEVLKHPNAGESDPNSLIGPPNYLKSNVGEIEGDIPDSLEEKLPEGGEHQRFEAIMSSVVQDDSQHMIDATYLGVLPLSIVEQMNVTGDPGLNGDYGDNGGEELPFESKTTPGHVDGPSTADIPDSSLLLDDKVLTQTLEELHLAQPVEVERDCGLGMSDDASIPAETLQLEIEQVLSEISESTVDHNTRPITELLQSDVLAKPSLHEDAGAVSRSSSLLGSLGLRGWKLLVTTAALFSLLVLMTWATVKAMGGSNVTLKRRARKAKTAKKISGQQPIEGFPMLSSSSLWGGVSNKLEPSELRSTHRSDGNLPNEVEGQDFSYLNSPSEDIVGRLPTSGRTLSPVAGSNSIGVFTSQEPLYHTTFGSYGDFSFAAERSPIRWSPNNLLAPTFGTTPETRLHTSTGDNNFVSPLSYEKFSMPNSATSALGITTTTPEKQSVFSTFFLDKMEDLHRESVLQSSSTPARGSTITPEKRTLGSRPQSSPWESFNSSSLRKSAQQAEQVSKKSSSAVETNPRERDLPPPSLIQKSPVKAAGGDAISFTNPDGAIFEDSSLGRFTTLLPVVHNEGTLKEQVKLTPVKRSSRIRTRLQTSPCKSAAAHLLQHPCGSCAEDGTAGLRH